MSVAYCKNCLKRFEDCECNHQALIYGETRLQIAKGVKLLKDRGEVNAANILDEEFL